MLVPKRHPPHLVLKPYVGVHFLHVDATASPELEPSLRMPPQCSLNRCVGRWVLELECDMCATIGLVILAHPVGMALRKLQLDLVVAGVHDATQVRGSIVI